MNYELKYCERCGLAFECKPGNITQCQCYEFQLSSELKAKIGEEYNDCLCAKCLRELADKLQTQKDSTEKE